MRATVVACIVITMSTEAAATRLRVCACVDSGRAALGLGESLAGYTKALFWSLVLALKAQSRWDQTGLGAFAKKKKKSFSFFGLLKWGPFGPKFI